jgi:hypothetical protein
MKMNFGVNGIMKKGNMRNKNTFRHSELNCIISLFYNTANLYHKLQFERDFGSII